MIPCPSCNRPLSDEDFTRGECPQCGLALQGGAVVDGSSPTGQEEQSRTIGTIDGDVVDFRPLQEEQSQIGRTIEIPASAPVQPPAEERADSPESQQPETGPVIPGGATIDLSRMQQTIDSDSVDFGELQQNTEEPGQPGPTGSRTIDSDSVEAGPVVLPQPGGATIDMSRMQQTIDSDSVDFGELQQSAAEPGQPGPTGSRTIDSDSVEAGPVVLPQPGGATIDMSRMQRTIDSDSVDFGELQQSAAEPGQPGPTGSHTIDSDSVQAGPVVLPQPGSATIDMSRMQRTIDSDSVDFGELQQNAAEPGQPGPTGSHTIDSDSVQAGPVVLPQPGGATIDMSRMQQTIDSDSVDFGSVASQANTNATIEIREAPTPPGSKTVHGGQESNREKQTVDAQSLPAGGDTDSVDLGGVRGPGRDLGATIEFGSGTGGSSFDVGVPPKETDSSITGAPIAHTVDSVDLPIPPQSDIHKTVSEKRLDVTVDSVEFVKPENEASRLNATIDSVDFRSPPPTGKGTVHDREINQTVDSVDLSSPPKKTGTVADRSVHATVDSVHFDQAGRKDRTVPDRDVMATYDSTEVTSRDARQVDQMWRGANVEKASPRMTIKGREAQQQTTKSSLVIQPRFFRQSKPTETSLGDADYDLIKMLGQGGMGVVYWARQASIDRNVAVKMLKPDMAKDDSQRNKFLAEAVITGDLDHPNIVPIYDLGKNAEGALFYAMKKVQGTPWDKAISKKTLSENVEILMKVADAVAFAHNRSVVHRDLKPENVMLGDFGEVLVMDWGLALPFGNFEKSRSIQPSVSMGGTPAYMSPEMATGPFDKIGPTSDVYLLGAILYEIITGKPPHTGKDVMKCLFAAAKNEIQPTEKTGELMDIALKAMATKQSDRYQTVQEFQQAIRDYESHAASIAMAARAGETLAAAEEADSYEQFATAVFEYQESLKLWEANTRAANGVPAAKLAYARSALRKGDLDLSESLLDVNESTHSDCLLQIEAAKQEREAKQHRLKAARRAVRVLAATVFIAVSTGLVAVGYQTVQVSKQRDLAEANAIEATKQRDNANVERARAETNEAVAKTERDRANSEKLRAEENAAEAQRQSIAATNARALAEKNEEEARQQRDLAVAARELANKNAIEADNQRKIAEYEEYVALIGLAAAKIEENAFGYARDLLNECPPEHRNWEWGRLMHMCQQSIRDFDAGAPLDAVAFAADGRRFATGGWNGTAQIWNAEDGSLLTSIPHEGLYVYAVAFSPDGNFLATGSSDRSGYLRIWNAQTAEPVRTLAGHEDGVVSVTYSRDGKKLLSTSFDNTARLWDVESGQLLQAFRGHTWWVWDADFSPDEQQVVTASQDGTALVWSVATGEHGPPFMGHLGPVYTTAFSPLGDQIVTGGADKRILLWRPSDLTPFDFDKLVGGATPPPPKSREFAGHLAAVRSVAFSRDGQLLVSGSHDNAVRVWSVESGDLVKTLRGHDSQVRDVAVSPNGDWIVSASHDQHARLWSVSGYAESRVLQGKWLRGHDDAIMAVGFAPNGTQIATASRDRSAKGWDASTGKQVVNFEEGHAFLASSAVFSADGKRLYTSAVDGTTRGWDLTSGVEVMRLENTGRAAALARSNNGRWILTGGDRQADAAAEAGAANVEPVWKAQLWDTATGKPVRELLGHAAEVTAVAFSPDDRVCFTGDANGRGVLWNPISGQEIRRLQWHTSKISAAVFLQVGSRLLTASDDKTVAQWSLASLTSNPAEIAVDTKLTLKHDDSVLSLDLAEARRLAITCSNDGKAFIWELDSGKLYRSLPVGDTNPNAVALSPDGKLAVTVHADSEQRLVRLWDVQQGREILVPGADGTPGPFLDLKILGGLVWSAIFAPEGNAIVTIGGNEARLWDVRAETHQRRELMSFSPHGAVSSVSYSPDGKRVVTGSWDNSARIWNAETGKAELKLVGQHKSHVNTAVFSPDGKWVLTASDDRTAKLWDASTGEVIRSFEGHAGPVRFAVFSPRGDLIVTTSDDKTARVWNAQTAALVQELTGHEWSVLCAAFSSDAQRVVTGSEDNTAKIWDVATGQVVSSLDGHTAPVTSVAYSPDDKRILTASEDFTAKLWDAVNGKEILNLKGHTQELTSVAFSRDGRYALTGSRDGTAILWLTTDWKQQAAPE